MDTNDLSLFIACSRLKSARRRKRLVKTDFDRKLRALDKKEKILYQQKRNLPLVPLKEPYRKGWVRFFVVREDVARSKYGQFYQTLLDKINTFQYDHDKSFRGKKKRKRGNVYLTRLQLLKEFYAYEWESRTYKLTEAEKIHFYPNQKWEKNKFVTKYIFNEPWRFVLKIKANMITHTKMVDGDLESELDYIGDYLDGRNLRGKLCHIRGKSAKWRNDKEKEQYKNPLKTKNWQDLME